MTLTFDLALDGPAYPGPLTTTAYAGSTWLGPLGLITVLETHLGLGGRFPSPLKRAAHLVSKLHQHPDRETAFWSRAFALDPLATARRLLHDRDLLALWGWQGQGLSPRLQALASATTSALPATPERLHAVVAALSSTTKPPIDRIHTHTPPDRLPSLWRALFTALQAAGVQIDPANNPSTNPEQPQANNHLCLLRPHGPLEAADEVAAALASAAAANNLDGVIIVGADAILEQALARHGLPRVGAGASTPASARLLPLIVEAAFHPMEMAHLHALLVAEPSPIPRKAAHHLVNALQQAPSRQSAAWNEALTLLATGHTEDNEDPADLHDRAQTFVTPLCHRNEALPLADLRKRLDLLRAWALRRQAFMPSLQVLVGQLDDFLETLEYLGAAAYSHDQLRRVLTDLGEPAYAQHPAQSGLVHVNHPGAILAPARAIVWWNFSRSSAPTSPRLLLSLAEQQAMRAAGLTPPDPAATMAAEAATWQRPFRAATEALYLVCPTFDGAGEPNHPHPAWDEMTASLKDQQLALRLQRRDMNGFMTARHTKVASRALVQPASRMQVPKALVLREVESPSSLERLLGCSLSWALHYAARVRAGRASPPCDVNPLLYGLIAHHVLADILIDERDPETAATRAASAFDAHVGKHAEMLELPRFQVEKAQLRASIAASAKRLVALIAQLGATVAGTEIEKTMKVERRPVTGTLDLLLQDPDMVIDLKWGKSHYRSLLESGTHVQLATYAAMVKRGKVFPETAYFSLNDQTLLAEPNGRLAADGRAPGKHCAPAVWQGTVQSLNRRVSELAKGQLIAPVLAEDEVEPRLDGEGVHVAPRCGYCQFGALCGIAVTT